jgi:hypothetical protein
MPPQEIGGSHRRSLVGRISFWRISTLHPQNFLTFTQCAIVFINTRVNAIQKFL